MGSGVACIVVLTTPLDFGVESLGGPPPEDMLKIVSPTVEECESPLATASLDAASLDAGPDTARDERLTDSQAPPDRNGQSAAGCAFPHFG